jgi:methylenetetrahydrofolate--tRNA-(uracil-5-)-methyltransferase
MPELIVIGGGLAGSEAAWQAAQQGVRVTLFEMRPMLQTGAHTSANLGELVCSNSLGSALIDRAPGLLKEELRQLGSLLIRCADESSIPSGGALAVDRNQFSQLITERLTGHPLIQVVREEARNIPDTPAIIASGPLTSPGLSQSIMQLTGREHLFFYDAIAPVLISESINMSVAFRASRYGRGEQEVGDYINCPLTGEEYAHFYEMLLSAERVELKEFERPMEEGVRAGADRYFEGCLPIEVLARRGKDTLAYGPMRPVGLNDPRTGRRPYAIVQLRQDNLAGTLYNMVGFQTNLKFSEQRRIFRAIPGLEGAEFARFGQMHRNTFIFSPAFLRPTMQFCDREDLFFAGQITGVEGYAGNIATGLLAGFNAARVLQGRDPVELPNTTMIGALCYYVTNASAADFQPMKANFGLLPTLEGEQTIRDKRKRYQAYATRALDELAAFVTGHDELGTLSLKP